MPNTPHVGHVSVIGLPRVFNSIAVRLKSIVNPHRAAHMTSGEFNGGTFILGPFGPRFRPARHGMEPFRRQASSFGRLRDLPPFDAACRRYSWNSVDLMCFAVAQPREF